MQISGNFYQYAHLGQSVKFKGTESPQENPYNITKNANIDEIAQIAEEQIGSKPHRLATAGYSNVPEGYKEPTTEFLSNLKNELGVNSTAFITSPTASEGTIDAITSQVAGMKKENIFYVTANEYTQYITPEEFPEGMNLQDYEKIPKYSFEKLEDYSKATAEASNSFIVTGGRDTSVSDFMNALEKGNKVVIVDNKELDIPAYDSEKQRVGNASAYLVEQIKAVKEEKEPPSPEIKTLAGDFNAKYINDNMEKIGKLVKVVELDSENSLAAAKEASDFLKDSLEV